MNFVHGNADRRNCVGNRVRIMRVRARIQDHGIICASRGLQLVHDRAFRIMLHRAHVEFQFACELHDLRIDLRERLIAVNFRLAFAE